MLFMIQGYLTLQKSPVEQGRAPHLINISSHGSVKSSVVLRALTDNLTEPITRML